MRNLSVSCAVYVQKIGIAMNITCFILSNKIGNCSERICKLLFGLQNWSAIANCEEKSASPPGFEPATPRPRSEHSTPDHDCLGSWIRSARVTVNLCLCVCVLIYYNGLPLFTGFISPGRKGSFIVLCSDPLPLPLHSYHAHASFIKSVYKSNPRLL